MTGESQNCVYLYPLHMIVVIRIKVWILNQKFAEIVLYSNESHVEFVWRFERSLHRGILCLKLCSCMFEGYFGEK